MKGEVLTTGLPGKSPTSNFFFFFLLMKALVGKEKRIPLETLDDLA